MPQPGSTFRLVAVAWCLLPTASAAARDRAAAWQPTLQDARPPVLARFAAWPVRIHRAPTTTSALPTAWGGVGLGTSDGIASFYWQEQMTSNGERFNRRALTAAHRSLPFGTRVRVTHVASRRQVVVRINDRGPFKPGRIIDLSEAAADHLGIRGAGLARVQLEVLR